MFLILAADNKMPRFEITELMV